MIHRILLFKLKPEVTPDKLEKMMMKTRMNLLKIPEVLSVKCGKKINKEVQWPFFIALEFESMDKLDLYRDDPVYLKFLEDVVKPHAAEELVLDYELDPGKDVQYS